MRNARRIRLAIAASSVAVLGGACVGVGVDDYEEFEAAVESGASCDQLIDIAQGFDEGETDRDRIDRDLRAIGCVDRSSERTDL